MAELSLATPRATHAAGRAISPRRADRHATDVARRACAREAIPFRLARRRRRVVRRRLVLLCDISGSMEPYARAYLQFLTCAAGAGRGRNEAFVFATRLTRLTRALHSRNPERAIRQAAATAPGLVERDADRRSAEDVQRPPWAAGDGARRGRRDPLRRLGARRPERSSAARWSAWPGSPTGSCGSTRAPPRPGSRPQAGGMAAALPYCDALVSGHSLDAPCTR